MPHRKAHSAGTTAVAVFTLLANLLSGVLPASATVRTWANAAGGSAGTSTNWSPNGVPGSGDNLLYTLANTYTVDFPATVPQVISHAFRGGFVTLTTSSPHACTSSWAVGSLGTGVATSSGGDFKAGSLFLGVSASDYGRFTITSSSGLPSTPSRFETTDSTQGTIVAGDGKARLEVFGGSLLFSAGNVVLANTSAARCTLNIAGRSAFTFTNSTFSMNPRRSFAAGLGGQAQVNVTNSGFLHIPGQATFGGSGTGVGTLSVSGTTFSANAVFDGPLYVGGNQFNSTLGGSGSVLVGNRGNVTVGGITQIGDPDGGGAATLQVQTGGTMIAGGGLTFAGNGTFTPAGGITNICGGVLTPSPNAAFNVGISAGPTDSPQVWIDNGHVNNYVSYFGGIGVGGTSGPGTLRVTEPGTTFGTTGTAPCYIGLWFGIPATLVVDSLATFEPGGAFGIGTAGPALATIAGGSQVHAGQTTVGANNTGNATLNVTGAGTLLRFKDRLYDGGTTSVSGTTSTVLADSGATITGITADSAATIVQVQGPQGHAMASNGGTIAANTVNVSGVAETQAGTYDALLVDVSANGSFGGHGHATGALHNAGVAQATGAVGEFGALRVGGAYTQGASASLRIRLGTEGGPVNDSLVVAGSASLNGILALEADQSFVRTVGDSFTVMTYGSRSGTFSALKWNGNFAGQLFDLVYEPNKLVVVVKEATVGVVDDTPRSLDFTVRNSTSRPELALDLPVASTARVDLYDVNGRRVAAVQDGALPAGRHEFALDASVRRMSPGVYFARAVVGNAEWTRTVRIVMH